MKRLFRPLCALTALLGCTASQHFGADAGSVDASTSETSPPPAADGGGASLSDSSATQSEAGSEGTWEWLSPIPHGHTLRAVWATDPNDIWLVGDHGSIARSDGVTAKIVYLGDIGQRFTAVWGSGPNDVWVGGDGGRSNLMHWDGTRWEDNFLISEEVITSLWGYGPNDVFAVGYDILRHWDGKRWSSVQEQDPGMREWSSGTRSLWGTKTHETWLASPAGLYYQTGPHDGPFVHARLPATWLEGTYEAYGVWGTDWNDVWVTARLKEGPHSNELSLLHYDGAAFSEASSTRFVLYRSDPEDGFGRTMWGFDGRPVFLHRRAAAFLFWDGSAWQDLAPPAWKQHPNRGGSILNFGYPPGMAVGGGNDSLYVVGGYGHTREVAKDSSGKPALRDFLSSGSDHLLDLQGMRAADGTTFALGDDGGLREWDETANRWRVVEAPEAIWSFSATSRQDIWASVGDRYQARALLHWNGTAWGSRIDTPCTVNTVLALPGGTVWAGGWNADRAAGCIVRWDGTRWFEPAYTGDVLHTVTAIGASGPDNVWFTAYRRLLQWDGQTLAARVTQDNYFLSVFVRSKNDVWAAGGESVHWDGTTWTTLKTDRTLRGVYGLSANDMWFIYDYGLEGRIGHWDGHNLTTVRGTSGRLFSIFGSADEVWVTGEGGSTLRLRTPVATP